MPSQKVSLYNTDASTSVVDAEVFKALAWHEGTITHVATGRRLTYGSAALAEYLAKEVNFKWLDTHSLGDDPKGRGATICLNNCKEAIKKWTSESTGAAPSLSILPMDAVEA